MFDLDQEVAAWSAKVHAERCQPAAGVAELTDHLYCEIDRGRAAGLSDEAAFYAAIARLGSASNLTAEHAKNRSALGTVCQIAAKLDGPVMSAENRRLLLAHAVIWAALMIAVAIVIKRSSMRTEYDWLLTTIFIPLWLASDQILQRALRHRETR
jgi:hypothetical protein